MANEPSRFRYDCPKVAASCCKWVAARAGQLAGEHLGLGRSIGEGDSVLPIGTVDPRKDVDAMAGLYFLVELNSG